MVSSDTCHCCHCVQDDQPAHTTREFAATASPSSSGDMLTPTASAGASPNATSYRPVDLKALMDADDAQYLISEDARYPPYTSPSAVSSTSGARFPRSFTPATGDKETLRPIPLAPILPQTSASTPKTSVGILAEMNALRQTVAVHESVIAHFKEENIALRSQKDQNLQTIDKLTSALKEAGSNAGMREEVYKLREVPKRPQTGADSYKHAEATFTPPQLGVSQACKAIESIREMQKVQNARISEVNGQVGALDKLLQTITGTLTEEVQTLKEAVSEQRAMMLNVYLVEEEVTYLQTERERMNNEIQPLKIVGASPSGVQQKNHAEHDLSQLQHEVDQVRARLAGLDKRADEIVAVHDARSAVTDQKINELQQNVNEIGTLAGKSCPRSSSFTIESLASTLRTVQAELAEQGSKLVGLRSDLEKNGKMLAETSAVADSLNDLAKCSNGAETLGPKESHGTCDTLARNILAQDDRIEELETQMAEVVKDYVRRAGLDAVSSRVTAILTTTDKHKSLLDDMQEKLHLCEDHMESKIERGLSDGRDDQARKTMGLTAVIDDVSLKVNGLESRICSMGDRLEQRVVAKPDPRIVALTTRVNSLAAAVQRLTDNRSSAAPVSQSNPTLTSSGQGSSTTNAQANPATPVSGVPASTLRARLKASNVGNAAPRSPYIPPSQRTGNAAAVGTDGFGERSSYIPPHLRTNMNPCAPKDP